MLLSLSQCWSGVVVPEQWGSRKKGKSLKERKRPFPPSFDFVKDTRRFLFCYKLKRGKTPNSQSFHRKKPHLHQSCDWFSQWLLYHHISAHPVGHSSFTCLSGMYWFEKHENLMPLSPAESRFPFSGAHVHRSSKPQVYFSCGIWSLVCTA